MEVRVAPVFVLASLGLCALFLVYRALPLDLRCNSIGANPWILEASSSELIGTNESSSSCTSSRNTGPDAGFLQEKSIAQYLKEKADKGLSNDELEGLDFSTRALLAELVQSVSQSDGAAVAAADPTSKEWGLFNFDYGVMRVVRRLVVCSAYRTSLREFTVVALSPDFTIPTSNPDFKNVPPKDPAVKRTCTWLADGSAGAPRFGSARELNDTVAAERRPSVGNGVAKFQWIGEHHGSSYDVLLIHCWFPKPVGTDLTGGFLYLNFTHGPHNSPPTELAPVFHEQPKMLNVSLYESPRKFQYEFAYCSGPIFTTLTPVHVKEFLMYHYALLDGSVHFFLYDSLGIDDETMAVLQPVIDAGKLTVVDFRKESEYHTWYHSQDLVINDCLYRASVVANWVLFWDMDEYLHVHPPLTLPVLLEQYKDAPWISFGKVDFALNHCAASNESSSRTAATAGNWAVERMLYRQEKVICGEMCDGDKGARKWMANPRKVRAGRIHSMADWRVKGGVVLSTRVALMNHFRGLVAPRGRITCQQTHPSNFTTLVEGKAKFSIDFELATLVSSTIKSSVEALQMFGGPGQ